MLGGAWGEGLRWSCINLAGFQLQEVANIYKEHENSGSNEGFDMVLGIVCPWLVNE